MQILRIRNQETLIEDSILRCKGRTQLKQVQVYRLKKELQCQWHKKEISSNQQGIHPIEHQIQISRIHNLILAKMLQLKEVIILEEKILKDQINSQVVVIMSLLVLHRKKIHFNMAAVKDDEFHNPLRRWKFTRSK